MTEQYVRERRGRGREADALSAKSLGLPGRLGAV